MLKFCQFLLLLGLLLLQACQKNSEVNDVIATKKYNLNEAATYNVQLGIAYLKQGNRPLAKRKLLLALTQAPNAAQTNAAMAYFLEKSGEINEAAAYYQKAMLLAPGSGAQLNNYGTFLCRQGHYQQAENYFLKAVKDTHYEQTAKAYENAGLCTLTVPNVRKAANYFIKALEQDPSLKQSLYELVKIEIKLGNSQRALAYVKKYSPLSMHANPTSLSWAENLEPTRKMEKIAPENGL